MLLPSNKALVRIAYAVIALVLAFYTFAALAGDKKGNHLPGDVYLEQADGGAVNARTGKYLAPAGPGGVVDAETGEFHPKAGPDGYIDPTGDYHPAEE